MLYRARRFGGVGRVSATHAAGAARVAAAVPLRARVAAARRALATDAAAAASTAAPAAAAPAAPAAPVGLTKREAAAEALNQKWNSEWTNRKDIHALLEAATDAPVPTGKYPQLPIRDAVLAKYPFRIQLEATVPMKMMRNKEYQFPHYKAKLSVNVQDMALSGDERRVFLELVGARRSGDKVSFVSREYASVEACEEKVYALLDGCITQARALAAQWRAADNSDAALQTLSAVKHSVAEPWDAAQVRGVLLPYEPKRSKISHKRTGLYLWKTGLRPTALGLARAAASVAAATTSTAPVPHLFVAGTPARPAAPAAPGSEQALKQQRRRDERKRRAVAKAAARAASAAAAKPMGSTASTAAV